MRNDPNVSKKARLINPHLFTWLLLPLLVLVGCGAEADGDDPVGEVRYAVQEDAGTQSESDQKYQIDDDDESKKANAVHSVELIEYGFRKGEQGFVYRGLKGLNEEVDWVDVPNPKQLFDRLLDLFLISSTQWEDYWLKREIAWHLRQATHGVYSKGETGRYLINVQEKKDLKDKLATALAQSKSKEGPSNGLEFELEVVDAMLGALPDTEAKWRKFGGGLKKLCELWSTKNPAKALELARELYTYFNNEDKHRWYKAVLYINYLKEQVVDEEKQAADKLEDLNTLQTLLYKYRKGDWQVLYAGIEALTYVVRNSQDPILVDQAYNSTDREKPGLLYYLNFNSFLFKNNWRVQEKAAESLILLTHHSRRLIRDKAYRDKSGFLKKRPHKSVRIILENPNDVMNIKQKLKRSWSHYEMTEDKLTRANREMREDQERMMKNQKQMMENQKELEELIRRNASQEQIEELISVNQALRTEQKRMMENQEGIMGEQKRMMENQESLEELIRSNASQEQIEELIRMNQALRTNQKRMMENQESLEELIRSNASQEQIEGLIRVNQALRTEQKQMMENQEGMMENQEGMMENQEEMMENQEEMMENQEEMMENQKRMMRMMEHQEIMEKALYKALGHSNNQDTGIDSLGMVGGILKGAIIGGAGGGMVGNNQGALIRGAVVGAVGGFILEPLGEFAERAFKSIKAEAAKESCMIQ